MSREIFRNRLRNFGKVGLRTTLASALFLAEDSAQPPHLAALAQFLGNRPVQAREFTTTENQDTPITRQILEKYVPMIEGRDIKGISQNFHTKEPLTWTVQDQYKSYSDRPKLTQAQMLSLFQESFNKRGAPRVVGYFWDMAYLGVIFENFGAPSMPGSSGYAVIGLISEGGAPPPYQKIYSVDEIKAADVAGAKQRLTPYSRTPSPEPTAIPVENILPKDIPSGKIAFIVNDKTGYYVTIANPDGSQLQRLTGGKRNLRGLRWLDSNTLVYSVLISGGGGGLMIYDLQSGKEKQITSSPSLDLEPFPAGKGVVFSRLSGYAAQDLYYVDRDGSNLRQLTSDAIYNVEDMPVVSPDGKLVAYSSHAPGQHGRPSGTVIEDWATLESNFHPDRRPVFINGGNPIVWSPDSQKLFFVKFENIGERSIGVGYIADKDGKNVRKLVEGLAASSGSGSWSPDGKYIIASLLLPGAENYQPYLIPVNGGKLVELFKVEGFVESVDWQPKPEQVKIVTPEKTLVRRMVNWVPGLINTIKSGRVTSGIFDQAINRIKAKGYFSDDQILFSLGGVFSRGNGTYGVGDQACAETLYSRFRQGGAYKEFILQHIKLHPGEPLTVVTHSNGGTVVLTALELMMDEGIEPDLREYKFIFTHAPAQGADKPYTDNIGGLLFPPEDITQDCMVIGSIPYPSLANFPVVVELREMWQNRKARQQKLFDITRFLVQSGARVYSLYNMQDCILAYRTCHLPEDYIEILREKGIDLVAETSFIPGAVNIGRYFGTSEMGHRSFLTGDGLSILLNLIGPQTPNNGFTRE